MKKPELEKAVTHHISAIEKYMQRLPGSFSAEDIHGLRVEYKQLRAFLRLLFGAKLARKLLSGAAKMYKTAGKIRDLQLFLPLLPQKTQTLQQFTQCLQQSLWTGKEKMVQEVEKVNLMKVADGIKKKLPGYMDNGYVQKFVQLKVASIKVILLAIQTEKDLHLIRKHLKDIILAIKLFRRHWGISFPVTAWESEKELNDVAASLGEFNDLCTAASFFTSACGQMAPENEIKLLTAWANKWKQQVQQQKKQLIPVVQQLSLTHKYKTA